MEKRVKNILKLILIMITISLFGVTQVYAADTIKLKSTGMSHGASVFKTSSGDFAYCMIKGIPSPPTGKTLKLAATFTKGPVVYIVNDRSISGTGDKGQIIRQKALWAYLTSVDSKAYGSYTLGGDYKDTAKKLLDAAKKAGKNYSINPEVTSITTPTMTKSGSYYTSQKLTVGLQDVKDNKYTVSFTSAPSGTKVIDQSGKTFKVQVPVSSVTKTTSFTIKVTGAKSPYKVVKKYHYDHKAHNTSRRQDIGVLVSTNQTPSKSVTAKLTYQTCHVVGNTYYGSKGTVVTQTEYYKQCNPKCVEKGGKYYDNNGKPVTQAEYYKACNPKCQEKGGKYYDPNGKPVTQAEYYKACNPKCAVKDGKYYDQNGKPVTQAEYYKACNPKCAEKDGKYYDPNGKPVTQAEYWKACNPKCSVVSGKYYDNNGKPVTQAEYYKACNPKCVIDNGKYYDNNGKPVTEAEYYKICNPKCEYKDGKYYDKNGKPVSQTEYYLSCNPKCEVKDGKYYDNNGKPVTETEYYQICNPKCEYKDGKYYDKNGKPVSQTEYYQICNPKCVYKDGKYYDPNGKPVTEAEYYQACNPKCTYKDGTYYDKNGKPVDLDTYYKDCFPVTPNPTPMKEVDTELIRYEQDYHYTITHEVPHRTKSDYYKSYVFEDVLEDPLQIKGVENVKIYQQDGTNDKKTDWTEKFDIKIDGQKITATLKNANEAGFYGTKDVLTGKEVNKKYLYVLTVSLRDNAETKFDMTKYKKGEDENTYIIPDVAHVTIINADGQKEDQPTNEVEVKYQLAPKPTKNVNKADVTDSYVRGTQYNYIITKQVPDYKGSQRYKKFVFKDVFEAPIQITSPRDLTIKNENGDDVTNWFNVTTNYQTLTATLKEENNTDNFYGHIYSFVATVNLKQGYNLDKYKQGDRYIIPNYATFSFDDKMEKTDVVDVYVKITEKVIKTPDTASTASVLGIAGGILLIAGAAYAMAVKSGIDPLGLYQKGSKTAAEKKTIKK